VTNNVSSFAANIHKSVYSLSQSLNASHNVRITTALCSDLVRSLFLEGGVTLSVNI